MTKEQMKDYLKEAWKEIFPESEVKDESDFFADGGDSIKAVQLTGWLLQKGVKLDLLKIFISPVLKDMAENLEETQPMYVPEEMLTKDILKDKIGIDPSLVAKYADKSSNDKKQQKTENDKTKADWKQKASSQMCTPQMCTSQMCTPQMCTPQMCTPQMCTPQMCTPQTGYPQMCTPQNYGFGGYGMPGMQMPMMPMVVMVPCMVMPPYGYYPMQYGNVPYGMNGYPWMKNIGDHVKSSLWSKMSPYQPHPVSSAIENPNITNIPEPQASKPEKSASEVLMDVLSGIKPDYNSSADLFSQGFTSFNFMQIVTRCAEQGYRVQIQDIVTNPTFDGIVSNMIPGED